MVRLYIISSVGKSENSAVVDRWNYPVKSFELRPHDFLKLAINKELHVRRSTEASPCEDLGEEAYYEVQLIHDMYILICIQLLFCSALVKCQLLLI